MVVDGAMTGEMFLAYVESCLVPVLRRNDIVVMDNCNSLVPSTAQPPRMRQLFHARRLCFNMSGIRF
jgi:hypothetical protein